MPGTEARKSRTRGAWHHHRSPQRPLKGDEGYKDDPDDSDEGNGAVNVRHDGHRTPRNEKGRREHIQRPAELKIARF
jgi:hypothetical protein